MKLAQISVEDSDLEYSEFSLYELGQAVAMMTVQALALDYASHQVRGFNRDRLEAEFDVPEHWQATSIVAVGHAHGTHPTTPHMGSMSSTTRDRHSLKSIVWRSASDIDRVL